jgi:TolC family type I secretion outer membrane protein
MKKFTVALCSVSLLAFSTSAEAAALNDAMASAYNTNPTLAAQRAALRSEQERIPQAYSEWLPTARLSYNRGTRQEEFGSTNERNTVTTKQATITQPVFDGFSSVNRLEQAANLVLAAENNLHLTEQGTLLDTVNAYVEVVRTAEVVKLSKANVSRLEEQLKATDERFKLGENTRTDVSQSQARLSRAKTNLAVAEGQVVASKANYERVVGEKPDALTMPTKLPRIPANLKKTISLSLEKNPALLASEYNAYAAENDIAINRGRILPTANITGNIRKEEGLASFFSGNERETEEVLLNVTIPLFQSGAEYSRVRQSKRNAERAERELTETHNQVVEGAISAWEDIKTARSTILSSIDAVKAAEVALEGVKQEAEVGSRTTLDVLDSEQELFNAQVELVNAQSQEIIATYNLKAIMGELTAKNLGLKVVAYDKKEYLDDVRFQFIGY